MYSNIVVALSLEHGLSELALKTARRLAADGASITAVHVHEPPNKMIRAYLEENAVTRSRRKAETRLAERVQAETDIRTTVLDGQSAGYVLTEFADAQGVDCIVIGSHNPGIKDFFLGSTAARVVRHAHCSVHVIRG